MAPLEFGAVRWQEEAGWQADQPDKKTAEGSCPCKNAGLKVEEHLVAPGYYPEGGLDQVCQLSSSCQRFELSSST